MHQGSAPDQRFRLAATCSRGLEEVVAGELAALGARGASAGRGVVRFRGGLDQVYLANLQLRAAVRVIVGLAEGPARNREELYDLAATPPWEEWIEPSGTLRVEAAGASAAFDSTAFAALVVKDAVVDRLRRVRGSRPDVSRDAPDLGIHLHLAEGRAEIGVDSSGAPLSRRGYRPRGGPAPLAESLAAGILLLAGYDGSQPLLDPMTGTGTFAVEAALIATRTAPGLGRRFAFERWPGCDRDRLQQLRTSLHGARVAAPQPVVARDLDPRAVAAARRNAREAGVAAAVTVELGDAREPRPPGPGALIVANPPYGVRLGERADLAALYRALGDGLKRHAAGCSAWLLVGDPALAKEIGLRPTRRIPLFNGPIECRLLRYDLYEGSRRGA